MLSLLHLIYKKETLKYKIPRSQATDDDVGIYLILYNIAYLFSCNDRFYSM